MQAPGRTPGATPHDPAREELVPPEGCPIREAAWAHEPGHDQCEDCHLAVDDCPCAHRRPRGRGVGV